MISTQQEGIQWIQQAVATKKTFVAPQKKSRRSHAGDALIARLPVDIIGRMILRTTVVPFFVFSTTTDRLIVPSGPTLISTQQELHGQQNEVGGFLLFLRKDGRIMTGPSPLEIITPLLLRVRRRRAAMIGITNDTRLVTTTSLSLNNVVKN